MRDDVPAGEGPSSSYHYRRSLDRGELLPVIGAAVGAAVAVGVVVFYGALLFAQRTPLLPRKRGSPGDPRASHDR